MHVESLSGESIEATAYRRHGAELMRFASSLVGPSDAADVVGEAMVGLLRSGVLARADSPRALMYTAVLRSAQSLHRSRVRRIRREQQSAEAITRHYPELQPEVIAAVFRLSPRQRACVYLTYWLDWTVDDVARNLGLSQGAVKRHLGRARRHLRSMLDE